MLVAVGAQKPPKNLTPVAFSFLVAPDADSLTGLEIRFLAMDNELYCHEIGAETGSRELTWRVTPRLSRQKRTKTNSNLTMDLRLRLKTRTCLGFYLDVSIGLCLWVFFEMSIGQSLGHSLEKSFGLSLPVSF